MRREENPGGSNIMTLAIIGVVGYFSYQYLVSSGMWAQWFGGAQPLPAGGGTNTIMQPAPGQGQPGNTYLIPAPQPVAQTPSTSALATQLQAAGNQYMANMQAAGTPVSGLNVDQWLFYYDQIRGASLFGTAQGESVIQAAGLSDATRSTIIPLATFMNALGGVGLSGIVTVPNQGPISAPLPTSQNFNRGYGGYSNGGYGARKGYLN